VNDAPVLSTSGTLNTDEDRASSAIALSATDVDGDVLTYSFSTPSKGSVTNNGNGTYTYAPGANKNGSDSFTVTVNDGTVDVSGNVDVTINALNDAPILTTSSALTINEDTVSSAIALSATDVDGDALTYSFSTPAKGSLFYGGKGNYTYTPAEYSP
jgi:VCBS repeat-containing protein